MSEPVRPIAAEPQRLGRYELICRLASGGMGVVYLGRLQGVGGFERLFAIKVLHKHLAAKQQMVGMLLNEARLAAQIQHPNVVSTVDAELSESGQYYVVMEYVDGFSLCELLDHPRLDAVRRVRLGLRVLLDAMAGLDAAHRLCHPSDGTPLAIIHRDVSPNNILIGLQGAGMIADFGIARVAAAQTDSVPGIVKGTPSYMAPEQMTAAEHLDARADVWGLGAVLWEVLTGEQLFYSPGGVGGVMALVMQGEIPAPSSRNSRIPAALDAVCLKALARDLGRRYQSVRELYEDLERIGRAQDLLASTHEVEEALSHLFAEEIARKRAALPASAASASRRAPFADEETIIAVVPPPPAPVASAPPPAPSAPVANAAQESAASAAAAPERTSEPSVEVARALDEEIASLPLRRAPWLMLAAAAAMIGLAGMLVVRTEAGIGVGVGPGTGPGTGSGTGTGTGSATEAGTGSATEAEADSEADSEVVAVTEPEAVAEAVAPERPLRAVRHLRVMRETRVQARALDLVPPYVTERAKAPGDESQRARDAVLETNPYLTQR